MARYTYETTLSFEEGAADFTEVDVTVSYAVSFGCAAQTYGDPSRCHPAEADEVDDIRLELVGDRKAPWGLHFHSDKHFAAIVADRLEASEHDLERMVEEAHEQEVGDYEAELERRWEDRRSERAA